MEKHTVAVAAAAALHETVDGEYFISVYINVL
jgi:hypothetical protein